MTSEDILDELDEPIGLNEYLDIGEARPEATRDFEQEAPAPQVTNEQLLNDRDSAESWLTWNKGLGNRGYTPADGLTPDNVGSLEMVWSQEFDSQRVETTPVVVPGDPPVMYFTYGDVTVESVNARTGERYWRWQSGGEQGDQNRGVAVMGDKVFVGTTDLNLHALNKDTGERLWSSSFMSPEQAQMTTPQERLSFAHSPMAYDGMVYGGQHGDSNGWTTAWAIDAETGELAWSKTASPKHQWVAKTWIFSSGASWYSPSIDGKHENLIVSHANPDPMYAGMARPGPNKNTNAIVAYDLKTGERQWSNQLVPHEVWDADNPTSPILFDMEVNGEERRIVQYNQKLGWSYFIDAETGELLERSEAWTWQTGSLFEGGKLRYPPYFTNRDEGYEKAGELCPHEGTEWPADAYSPDTGLTYIGANNDGNWIYGLSDWEFSPEFTSEGGAHGALREEYDPHYGEQWTEVVAVDPTTGEQVWQYEHDGVDPAGHYISIYGGGTTATGGNLVFNGSSAGNIIALNAETGERLWRENVGERVMSSPVIWEDPADGRQYVSAGAYDKIVTFAADI